MIAKVIVWTATILAGILALAVVAFLIIAFLTGSVELLVMLAEALS